jgi:hypothetical protein
MLEVEWVKDCSGENEVAIEWLILPPGHCADGDKEDVAFKLGSELGSGERFTG